MVSKAVRLSLHGLDLVVGGFQRSCRDRVIVVGEDSLSVGGQGFGNFLEYSDAGSLGSTNPVFEHSIGGGFVRLVPDLSGGLPSGSRHMPRAD